MWRRALVVSVLGFALASGCGEAFSGAGPAGGAGATDATGGAGAKDATGGSGGSNAGADAACVAEGDRCIPGSPVMPCLVGYDCCKNICDCAADGRVDCHIACGPQYGSGGNCGVDGSAGSAGAIGDGGDVCPAYPFDAIGTHCSTEGMTCSEGCTDACSFCNVIRCQGGTWQKLEVFPDPSCRDGGLEAGATCTSDQECGSGLKCCYPCGIPDCQNVCMTPDIGGSCPLFPSPS
jgi:hypothetical protein